MQNTYRNTCIHKYMHTQTPTHIHAYMITYTYTSIKHSQPHACIDACTLQYEVSYLYTYIHRSMHSYITYNSIPYNVVQFTTIR